MMSSVDDGVKIDEVPWACCRSCVISRHSTAQEAADRVAGVALHVPLIRARLIGICGFYCGFLPHGGQAPLKAPGVNLLPIAARIRPSLSTGLDQGRKISTAINDNSRRLDRPMIACSPP